MIFVFAFRRSRLGRLARVFCGETDRAERIAGQVPTLLRTRSRSSRMIAENRTDPVGLDKHDVYCPDLADVQ
ncbi:hypothetical protein C5B85_02600 [Pseudoclavibacter sp. AY1F1]|nr:hypothetical protein C5B85_02600 [Pseudoclavibacter sp. AY1F1]